MLDREYIVWGFSAATGNVEVYHGFHSRETAASVCDMLACMGLDKARVGMRLYERYEGLAEGYDAYELP